MSSRELLNILLSAEIIMEQAVVVTLLLDT